MEEANNKVNKNRWVILILIVMVTFMSTLDGSIVNVALPNMAKKMEVTTQKIQWVVTSYLMVISAAILIFGRLGDIKGKTKVFRFGLALFTLGSILCGITDSLLFLVIARCIQAVGAAGSMANSQGIITQAFPARERGKALGISGTFVALGTMVGPPLGGFIIDIASWKYIFLINVPIGIIIFILTMKYLPKGTKQSTEKLDLVGAVLFALFILPLFAAINEGQAVGFTQPIILFGFAVAFVSLIIFIMLERKLEEPLLHLEIFKNKLFSLSIFCGFISFVAIFCSNIIQPFYLQNVLKLTPSTTGLFMTIYPIILAVVAPVSGHLSDKIGSEILTFIGLIFTSVGLFLMSTLNEYSSLGIMVFFIAAMSVGNGLFQSPNNSLVMSTVPKNKLGIAGSVNALVRNLGMVCGIALSTTLLYNRMSYKIGYHVSDFVEGRSDVFIYGMRVVYITAGVICLFGAIITALRLYSRRSKVKA